MKKFLLSVLVVMFLIVPMVSVPNIAYAESATANLSSVSSEAYDYMREYVTNENNNVPDYQLRQKNRAEYLINLVNSKGWNYILTKQNVRYANRFNQNANESADNLIFTKKANDTKKTVVIAANYDNAEGLLESIQNSDGATSNGVGIGVMLALMEQLNNVTLDFNVEFIFFAASEVGLMGSRYYVTELTNEQKDNMLLAINLWGVGAGDNTYLYDDELHWQHYEYFLNKAKDSNYAIKPMPADKKVISALEDNIGLEYTHQALLSDATPFIAERLPSISLFSGNFTERGYVQSKQFGNLMATKDDNIKKYDEIFGDKGKTQMNQAVDFVKDIVTDNVLPTVMLKSIKNKPDYSFFTTKNEGIIIVTGVVTGLILLGMVIAYFIIKNKADKSNDPIKPMYIDIDGLIQPNGNITGIDDQEEKRHEDPFGLDDDNENNNSNNDNPFDL